jgi:hypothetical protein
MPELGSYGSVRGARGNSRPYRESAVQAVPLPFLTHLRHRGPTIAGRPLLDYNTKFSFIWEPDVLLNSYLFGSPTCFY